MRNVCLIIMLCSVAFGCKHFTRLEQALVLSGENRAELEQVLAHYKQLPADSLKYKAASFLIENMAIHYSAERYPDVLYDILDSLYLSDLNINEIYVQFGLIRKTVPKQQTKIMRDLEMLSSAFLIWHIDQTFEIWEKSPWKDAISFSDFCEYVLPYQVGNEKRELWADYYRNKYEPILSDYLQHPGVAGINLKDACNYVNDSLIASPSRMVLYYEGISNFPALKADHIRSGLCSDYMARCTYVMRSLGIPVSVEYCPQWGDYRSTHSWNSLLGEDGSHSPFTGFDANTRGWFLDHRIDCAKMFRYTYSIQESSLAVQHLKEPLPGFLNQPNLIDVTAEYLPVSDISIPIKDRPKNVHSKAAYLYVFNNTAWIPVHWAFIKNGTAVFTDMGRKVVYLPGFHTKEGMVTNQNPILVDSTGNVISLTMHPGEKQTLRLERKFHTRSNKESLHRMLDGLFQGANNPDFSDCEDLYRVDKIPKSKYNVADINTKKAYRYIRYIGAKESSCNVAELEFYTNKGSVFSQLSGKIIGTNGSYSDIPECRKEAVFDGDMLTYFDGPTGSGCWVGLDLGRSERIDRIRFLPRNDDNNIHLGDLYELFYWNEGEWHSLGQQTGNEEALLTYENCPVGALFLLRDLTRGKEERIFTYENGKQMWW